MSGVQFRDDEYTFATSVFKNIAAIGAAPFAEAFAGCAVYGMELADQVPLW